MCTSRQPVAAASFPSFTRWLPAMLSALPLPSLPPLLPPSPPPPHQLGVHNGHAGGEGVVSQRVLLTGALVGDHRKGRHLAACTAASRRTMRAGAVCEHVEAAGGRAEGGSSGTATPAHPPPSRPAACPPVPEVVGMQTRGALRPSSGISYTRLRMSMKRMASPSNLMSGCCRAGQAGRQARDATALAEQGQGQGQGDRVRGSSIVNQARGARRAGPGCRSGSLPGWPAATPPHNPMQRPAPTSYSSHMTLAASMGEPPPRAMITSGTND